MFVKLELKYRPTLQDMCMIQGWIEFGANGGGDVDTRGVVNGGVGGGGAWTVELKLNRKTRKKWIPTGVCDPLPPLLDPPL